MALQSRARVGDSDKNESTTETSTRKCSLRREREYKCRASMGRSLAEKTVYARVSAEVQKRDSDSDAQRSESHSRESKCEQEEEPEEIKPLTSARDMPQTKQSNLSGRGRTMRVEHSICAEFFDAERSLHRPIAPLSGRQTRQIDVADNERPNVLRMVSEGVKASWLVTASAVTQRQETSILDGMLETTHDCNGSYV